MVEDLNKVINRLTWGKTLGHSGISPDLIKLCKRTLLALLKEILSQCWWEGTVLQEMRDARIITLLEQRSGKWLTITGGISLFSIIDKLFAWVLLTHLQKLAISCLPSHHEVDLICLQKLTDHIYRHHKVWYDRLPSSASGEMQRTVDATVHHFHWPHYHLWPG